jgi:hypothetical protein
MSLAVASISISTSILLASSAFFEFVVLLLDRVVVVGVVVERVDAAIGLTFRLILLARIILGFAGSL